VEGSGLDISECTIRAEYPDACVIRKRIKVNDAHALKSSI
jgi:hypothetical protein